MKKTIGICLFTVFLISGILVTFLVWNKRTDDVPNEVQGTERIAQEQTESTQEMVTESMTVQQEYQFLILEQNGMLVVYDKTGSTILLETGISTRHLDAQTMDLLEKGIPITDEGELYDFLESYSS